MVTKPQTIRGAMLAAALCAAIFGGAPQAKAQSGTDSGKVVLTPGTVIPVTLDTALSSNDSRKGDTFTATVDTSKDAYNRILRGATVDGVVRDATPQSGSDPGTLDLAFTRLKLSDGQSYPISGTLSSLDTKMLATDDSGILKAKNTNKDNHVAFAGIGAGAGALAGILGGHKLKIEDILLGGLAGYGVGSVVKGQTQVHDVALPAGTMVGVLLGNRVGYYHRSHRSASSAANKQSNVNGQSKTAGHGKYYSYQGHPYFLDLTTGERTRLD